MLFLKRYIKRSIGGAGGVWLVLMLLGSGWSPQVLALSTTCYCSDGRDVTINDDFLSNQCVTYVGQGGIHTYYTEPKSTSACSASMTMDMFTGNTYSCTNVCTSGTPKPQAAESLAFWSDGTITGTTPEHIWQGYEDLSLAIQSYEPDAIKAVSDLFELGDNSTELIMNGARDNVRGIMFLSVINLMKKDPATRTVTEQKLADYFTQKVHERRIEAAQFSWDEYNNWNRNICNIGWRLVNGTGWAPPEGFSYDWDKLSIPNCIQNHFVYLMGGGPTSPSAEEFISYGVAHAYSKINKNAQVHEASKRTARTLITMAAFPIATLVAGTVFYTISAAGLVTAVAGTIAPFAVSNLAVMGIMGAVAGAAAAVAAVVFAVIIGTVRGIAVVEQAAIPNILQDRLANAKNEQIDSRALASTSLGMSEIYPNFILESIPDGGAKIRPKPIADTDPNFLITDESGLINQSTVATIALKPYDDSKISWINVRMSGRWFALTEKSIGSIAPPEALSLVITIKDWDNSVKKVWRKNKQFLVLKEDETDVTKALVVDKFSFLDAQGNKRIAGYIAPSKEEKIGPPIISFKVNGVLNGNSSAKYASDANLEWVVLNPDGTPVPSGDKEGCVNQTIVATNPSGGISYWCKATNIYGSNDKWVPIVFDLTPPLLQISYSAQPNSLGWYNQPVTIAYSCQDPTQPELPPGQISFELNASGIVSCPQAEAFVGGVNAAVNQSVQDGVGNQTTLTRSVIRIDRSLPVAAITAISPSAPNAAGWLNQPSRFTVECNDAGGSGLLKCPDQNMFDPLIPDITIGGNPTPGPDKIVNEVYLKDEGIVKTTLYVKDKAGNRAELGDFTYKLDMKPPTIILASSSPMPNAEGWNSNDVTLKFSCTDNENIYPVVSGIKTCPNAQTISTEGIKSFSYTVVDNADNQQQMAVEVKLDKTAPTIDVSVNRQANAAGWYNDTVIASFNCSDAGSGIKTCPALQTLTEGVIQKVTGTAEDKAGNQATAEASFSIDTTVPQISGAATRVPNTNGWYNSDVSVSFNCTDSLSGIKDCSAQIILSTEGKNLTVTGTARNHADLTSSVSVDNLNLDKTAPTCSVNATPNQLGLMANAVVNINTTVTTDDSLSGVSDFKLLSVTSTNASGIQGWTLNSADTSGQLIAKKGVSYTLTYEVLDNAGNVGQCSANIVGLFNMRG